MIDTIYTIEVRDFDEGDLLMHLAYTTEEEYLRALEIIEEARCEWWEKEIDYCLTEHIEKYLMKEKLLGITIWKAVREV
jgi:hypothetical protein